MKSRTILGISALLFAFVMMFTLNAVQHVSADSQNIVKVAPTVTPNPNPTVTPAPVPSVTPMPSPTNPSDPTPNPTPRNPSDPVPSPTTVPTPK